MSSPELEAWRTSRARRPPYTGSSAAVLSSTATRARPARSERPLSGAPPRTRLPSTYERSAETPESKKRRIALSDGIRVRVVHCGLGLVDDRRARRAGRGATTPGPRSSRCRPRTGTPPSSARGMAEFTFENSVGSKLSSRRRRAAARERSGRTGSRGSSALEESRRRAAAGGRRRPRSARRRERRGQAREPGVVCRVRVLAREDERVAPCELGADVARAPVVELRRRDLVDACAEAPRSLGAPVARAGVDDDYLDLVVDPLARDRLKAAHEVGAPVLHRDDDRDHARATRSAPSSRDAAAWSGARGRRRRTRSGCRVRARSRAERSRRRDRAFRTRCAPTRRAT